MLVERARSVWVAAISTLVLVACMDVQVIAPDDPGAVTVTITQDTAFIDAIAAQVALHAEVAAGPEAPPDLPAIQWSSPDTAILEVDGSGRVTALAEGSARVTATVLDAADTAVVVVQQIAAFMKVKLAAPGAGGADTMADGSTIGSLEALGDTVRFVASARDRNGYDIASVDPEWTTIDPSIATVDTSGVVTSMTNGETLVVAKVRGNGDTAVVRVHQKPREVIVEPSTAELAIQIDTVRFSATVLDRKGATIKDAQVTWGSSEPAIVSIDSTGTAVGMASGSATITATSAPRTGTAQVTVVAEPAADLGSVTISPQADTLRALGDTIQLTATVQDASGSKITGAAVEWTSLNPETAQVDNMGRVTAKMTGLALIVAAAVGCVSDTVTALVDPEVAEVQVAPDPASLDVGTTLALAATALDANGNSLPTNQTTWTSSNTGVATVSSGGVVSGVAAGSVTITATVNGVSGNTAVTVGLPAPGMPGTPVPSVSYLSADSFAVVMTWTVAIGAARYDWKTGTNSGEWSDAGEAQETTVSFHAPRLGSANGYWFCVTAIDSKGRPSADQACRDYYAPADSSSTAPVAAVEIDPASASILVGRSILLVATPVDADGFALDGRTITWSTGNAAVATVDGNGRVTGVSAGSAVITATSEGKNGSATITVNAPTGAAASYDPPPVGSPNIIFDYRSGGNRDLQAAGSFAAAKALFDLVYPADGFDYTTDFDGQGTAAMVLKWVGVGSNYGDQSRNLHIYAPTPYPTDIYWQYKIWGGRTPHDTDVAWGALQSFDPTNQNDLGSPNAARKLSRWVGRYWDGSTEVKGTALWRGPAPSTPQFYSTGYAGDYPAGFVDGASFTDAEYENAEWTFTFHIKAESAKGAVDGLIGMRVLRNGTEVVFGENTGRTDMMEFLRVHFPSVMRSPIQDQSEYVWDIVMWTAN